MKEHNEPLHIEKRLDKISICDHAYFQKSEMWKHHKSVHSKDRSHNYSVCEFSSSRMDILKRHVNNFLKDMLSQNLLKLWPIFWMNRFVMFSHFTFLKISMITDRDLVQPFLYINWFCTLFHIDFFKKIIVKNLASFVTSCP